MASFIIYIIRWALCLTLLYSLFGLFMKRETLHSLNRLVLLFVLVGGMVLPLCQIEIGSRNIVTQSREMIERQIASVQNPLGHDSKRPTIGSPEHGVAYTHSPIREDVNASILMAIAVYLAGLLVCWLRYLWQLAALLLLIRRSSRVKPGGVPRHVHVVTNPSVMAPCSWMLWVILNPTDVRTRAIIEHELAHIRLGHSWDMLLCELTCRMLWFVPFAWMLRQDLRDVHEYQADQRVLQGGLDENEYQLLLIRKATSTGLQPVVNAFNQSQIKRRFKMMYRKPSRRWVALKAAYLAPLSALALVAFARPQTLGEIEKRVEQSAPALSETVTATVKTVAQHLPALAGETARNGDVDPGRQDGGNGAPQPAPGAVAGSEASTDTSYVAGSDANLLKADLAESGHFASTTRKTPAELLDSTMLAVGARKIAEGTYVGHFQPSLSSDTVRIARATILNRESRQTGEHRFAQNAANPNAYNITLNAETRKDRTGYYIRYMQPVASTQRNYDKKTVDPYLLSTDSVLTGRSNKNMLHYYFTPVAIERGKQETRIFMYIAFSKKRATEIFKQRNIHMYENLAIVDEKTGDQYVCRSTDYTYFKQVKEELAGKDTVRIFQSCLVFPPLGKHVGEVHFGRVNDDDNNLASFDITKLPRKGRVITN